MRLSRNLLWILLSILAFSVVIILFTYTKADDKVSEWEVTKYKDMALEWLGDDIREYVIADESGSIGKIIKPSSIFQTVVYSKYDEPIQVNNQEKNLIIIQFNMNKDVYHSDKINIIIDMNDNEVIGIEYDL